jgi:hypothetical protein
LILYDGGCQSREESFGTWFAVPKAVVGKHRYRGVGPVVSSTTTALNILLDEEETYAKEMVQTGL